MIIYKTTNLINGKFYIGKDSNNNDDYIGSGKLLHIAIKKYGKENFIKEIIDTAKTSEELNEKEIYWIEKMNSRNLKIGYNISVGGDGISRGTKFSNTHKENMKKSWTIKRRKSHSENLTGKNNPFYGKSHSEKTITEISKKAKDRKLSVETKNKISLATKGAPKPIGFGDTRKGSLNGRAKKYTLISPLNETYHANGNIHELVNEHNLFWRFLIKYKNSQIPLMIIKGKCKTAKENSIGWSLYDNE